MRTGAVLLGALATAGVGVLATSSAPDPLPPGKVIVAASPKRPPSIFRDDLAVPPRPAFAATGADVSQIERGSGAKAPTGYLDDADVEEFHGSLNWDGGADPAIWAKPAEFSETD